MPRHRSVRPVHIVPVAAAVGLLALIGCSPARRPQEEERWNRVVAALQQVAEEYRDALELRDQEAAQSQIQPAASLDAATKAGHARLSAVDTLRGRYGLPTDAVVRWGDLDPHHADDPAGFPWELFVHRLVPGLPADVEMR